MAGLPVIASDWRFNSELVEEGKTGFLINLGELEKNLYEKMVYVIKNKETIKLMRSNCFFESKNYNSDIVLKPFIDMIDKQI